MTDQPDRVDVSVTEHHDGQMTAVYNAAGPPQTIAAYLRALAATYDPPKPTMRGTDDPPGPASGLRIERRDTPDHTVPRNRNRAGFAPTRLEQP
jgi:hypothetical protein